MAMVTEPIEISFQLQVLPDHSIIIPGCEPTSAISSAALSYSLALNGCQHPKVPIKLILDKIPGSYIKFGWNFNLGYNQTWLVFPPYMAGCPCDDKPDWYNMLRCIASEITDPIVVEKNCDVLEREFCNPEVKPGPSGGGGNSYVNPAEGPSALGYGGILPPIPPWARKQVDYCKLAGMDKEMKMMLQSSENILDSILGT